MAHSQLSALVFVFVGFEGGGSIQVYDATDHVLADDSFSLLFGKLLRCSVPNTRLQHRQDRMI